MKKTAKKRPCSICGKWFEPHPRARWCQRTCGAPACRTAQRSRTQREERERRWIEEETWRIGELTDDIEREFRERERDAANDPHPGKVRRGVREDSIGVERHVLLELLRDYGKKTRCNHNPIAGKGNSADCTPDPVKTR